MIQLSRLGKVKVSVYIKLLHPVLIRIVDTCENCQDVATLHCDQCSHSYCNIEA